MIAIREMGWVITAWSVDALRHFFHELLLFFREWD
jgi:hypothetical protein